MPYPHVTQFETLDNRRRLRLDPPRAARRPLAARLAALLRRPARREGCAAGPA